MITIIAGNVAFVVEAGGTVVAATKPVGWIKASRDTVYILCKQGDVCLV